MNNIQEFIVDMLIEAGFHPEDHEDLIKEIEPILLKRIITKIALKLAPEQREEAELLLSKADSQGFNALCQKAIPNYEEYFVEILKEFEEGYLSNFKK
ncbi:MAG: hypothetical protein PHR61_00405 [Candidatus Absconditabacteria bacterium]|nr:hypothetical protein [Candidatus Absconditabacteria bacterium]